MRLLVVTTEAVGAEKRVAILHIRPLLHKLLNVYLTPAEPDTPHRESTQDSHAQQCQWSLYRKQPVAFKLGQHF